MINRTRVGDTGGNRFSFQVSLGPLPAEQTTWSIEGSADEALQLTRDWRSGAVDHAQTSTLTTTVDASDPTPVAFVQSSAGVAHGRSGTIADRRFNGAHLHHVAIIHETGWIVSRDRDGEDNVWTLSIFPVPTSNQGSLKPVRGRPTRSSRSTYMQVQTWGPAFVRGQSLRISTNDRPSLTRQDRKTNSSVKLRLTFQARRVHRPGLIGRP